MDFKILIKGDGEAGKTELGNRLSGNKFSRVYKKTLDTADYKYKKPDDKGNIDTFNLVEITNNKRMGDVYTRLHRPTTNALIYCISISQSKLAEMLPDYKKEIDEILTSNSKIKLIVVATKVDQKDYEDNLKLIQQFAKENACSCIETSAWTNTGITELKNQISALVHPAATTELPLNPEPVSAHPAVTTEPPINPESVPPPPAATTEPPLNPEPVSAHPAATTELPINPEKERLILIVNTLIKNIENGTGRKTSGRGSAKVKKLRDELTAITTAENFNEQATIVRLKKICAEQRHPWRLFHTPHSARELEELLEPSSTIFTPSQQ
ncbi:GTP-binding protein [Legionella dresdenensis]|uniref:GTP-binding protein n=1 Tax=Legionella dresdenensis TaxID=450200 RepID=A0ABV8CIF1_9GAMM